MKRNLLGVLRVSARESSREDKFLRDSVVRFVLVAMVVFAALSPQRVRSGDADDEALRRDITAFSRNSFSTTSPERRRILESGPKAANAILDAVQSARWTGGGVHAIGVSPTARPERINEACAVLRLLDDVDAPLPVDRLCSLVEMGVGAKYRKHAEGPPGMAHLTILSG